MRAVALSRWWLNPGIPKTGKPMFNVAPYYVLVDANVWVEKRLLKSSIGSAFLYAVTGAKSAFLLPEVVELEIARVLLDLAERAVGRSYQAFVFRVAPG
jgi:hypothetical protein